MKEQIMALSAWREQALSRGHNASEVPTAHELGLFVRNRNNPSGYADKPNLVAWSESLNRLLQAVDAGAFDKSVPLRDYFFNKAGADSSAAQPQAQEQVPEPAPQPEPQAAPQPTPKQAPPEAQKPTPQPLQISGDRFAEWDPFANPEPLEAPGGKVRVEATGSDPETYEVTWNVDSQAPVQIFRVLSSDLLIQADALEPSKGNLRTVSAGRIFVDDLDIYGPVRTYHVWLNEGPTQDAALDSQPMLVGHAVYVVPITDFLLEETAGRIDGSWTHIPDTDRVDVVRLDPRHGEVREFEGDRNLHGFNWSPEQTGRTYTFKARRFVGEHYSEFSAEQSVYVEAELEKIGLNISRNGSSFNIDWNQPSAGQVRILATPEPLKDGITDQRIATEALAAQQMGNNVWSNRGETETTTHSLSWPADWYSVTISAVHVVGEWAQVGHTRTWVRCGTPTDIQLFQRVEEQIVTFGWPAEAHGVELYLADSGIVNQLEALGEHDITRPPGMTLLSAVTENEYKRSGGMRVDIPADPAPLVLMPYRNHDGQRIYGKPAIHQYEGLHRVSYEFARGSDGALQLAIFSHSEHPRMLSFVLRAQRGSLPIDQNSREGQVVKVGKIARGANPLQPGPMLAYVSSQDPFVRTENRSNDGEYFIVDTTGILNDPDVYLRLFLQDENPDEFDGFSEFADEFQPEAPAVLLDPSQASMRPFYTGEPAAPVQPPVRQVPQVPQQQPQYAQPGPYAQPAQYPDQYGQYPVQQPGQYPAQHPGQYPAQHPVPPGQIPDEGSRRRGLFRRT